jgi:hypothetical protein
MKHTVTLTFNIYDDENLTDQIIRDINNAFALFGDIYDVPEVKVKVTTEMEKGGNENVCDSAYS